MCIFICILNHITDFEGMWGVVPWWNSLLLTTESYAAGSEVCTEQPCSLLCFLCLISSFFWLLHLEVICRGQDTDCNSSTVSYAATVSLKVESEICIITTINSNMQVLWSSLIRVSQSILQREKAIEHFFLQEKTFQQLQLGVSVRFGENRFGNRDHGSSAAVAARLSTLTRWPEVLWEGWSKAV